MARHAVTGIMATIRLLPMRPPLPAMIWRSCERCSMKKVRGANRLVGLYDLCATSINVLAAARRIREHAATRKRFLAAVAINAIIHASGYCWQKDDKNHLSAFCC